MRVCVAARSLGPAAVAGAQAGPLPRVAMSSWEENADGESGPAPRNEALRGQLARVELSEETLALFESEDVDLNLLLELDAESLDEIEFKAGERDRLQSWLKAVVSFRSRCADLKAKIN